MKIKTWHIVGVVFVFVFGCLLHFAYEWSGFNPVFAIFGSVNESVWEHLKLLFWPYCAFAMIELWEYGKNCTGFFTAKLLGVLSGMAAIVAVFYTYFGILGTSISWLDILLFAVGDALAFCASYRALKRPCTFGRKYDFVSFLLLLLIAFMFCFFTLIGICPAACTASVWKSTP